MILKAEQERQGWTRPSDIAWAVGYLIVTILLVLLWDPARTPVGKRSGVSPRVHRASAGASGDRAHARAELCCS